MKLINTIFKYSKNINKSNDFKIEKVREYSLYLSFLMFIVYAFLTTTIIIFKISSLLLIILSASSLIINFILIYFLSRKSRSPKALSFLFSFFSGISLSSIPNMLFSLFKNNISFGRDFFVFNFISFSFILIILIQSFLYFIKGFLVNNFYFKWILLFLLTLFIGIPIIFILKNKYEFISLTFNIIVYIVSSFLFSFFNIIYSENIRISFDDGINKMIVYNLSILNISLIYFFIFELIPKRNNE